MTPLDMDEIANIAASKLYRMRVCMTPLDRRAAEIRDATGCSEEEAEAKAIEQMEKEEHQ